MFAKIEYSNAMQWLKFIVYGDIIQYVKISKGNINATPNGKNGEHFVSTISKTSCKLLSTLWETLVCQYCIHQLTDGYFSRQGN
jgi:hypothetical protein